MLERPRERKKTVWELDLGANPSNQGITFKLWAPHHLNLSIHVEGKGQYPMQRDEKSFFVADIQGVEIGDRYSYVFENGLKRPDPVSRSLPNGVHGPTEIVDPFAFDWGDRDWKGIALKECIFYEIHVGTFTPHGTFEGVIEKLDYLKDLGINCIEIMPIAQFPGRWNWGYDGASLFAPYGGYGGCVGFKRLVDACHKKEIAVCLDLVYNHLGPEGNYLEEFGPYFSSTYHTPWGKAFNYDGAYSDSVREYVIKNALHWIVEYHVDILRLDAIHGIYDFSASPMLAELVDEIKNLEKRLDRKIYVIAESSLNDSRVIREKERGGWNLCALWNDDFHHAAHVALTNEQESYYIDFNGLSDFSKALSEGNVYDGRYSPFRKRRHGNSFEGIPLDKMIVFIQNHDQIGNRPLGERLSTLVTKERLKVAACMALMTPSIPLLFMGEEYGEKAPFEYFVDYADEQLMRSIYEGRKREFHREEMPYPGKESFDNSRLTWSDDREISTLYRTLITLRKKYPPKEALTPDNIGVYCSVEEEWVAWEYPTEKGTWLGVLCYLGKGKTLSHPFKNTGQEILLATENIKQKKEGEWQVPSECALILK